MTHFDLLTVLPLNTYLVPEHFDGAHKYVGTFCSKHWGMLWRYFVEVERLPPLWVWKSNFARDINHWTKYHVFTEVHWHDVLLTQDWRDRSLCHNPGHPSDHGWVTHSLPGQPMETLGRHSTGFIAQAHLIRWWHWQNTYILSDILEALAHGEFSWWLTYGSSTLIVFESPTLLSSRSSGLDYQRKSCCCLELRKSWLRPS